MSVPSSRRPNLAKLIEALSSADPQPRESAAARLTILGTAAVAPLRALVATGTAATEARVAALRTLAGIAGSDAVAAAIEVLAGPVDALALEGIDVLRGVLDDGTDAAGATRSLEQLTQLALSAVAPAARRLAAFDALSGLPETLLSPIREALVIDDEPAVAARARGARPAGDGPARLSLADVLGQGQLPDAPASVSAAIRETGDTTAVTELRRTIDLVRAREQHEHDAGNDAKRAAWLLVRGQLHRTLAERDSHIALYDLRETLERPDSELSVDYLIAAARIADVTCLDALALRWVAAADGDRWLRDQLEQAVRAIIERDQLTRSHPVLTKLLARVPASGPLVALARRKAGRRQGASKAGSGQAGSKPAERKPAGNKQTGS